jgi:gamma-glutamylcyclotransferase (GGCT)/AIG2-like uncharacterized protein YtfP
MTRPGHARMIRARKIRVDIDQLNHVLLQLKEDPDTCPETRELLSALFQPEHRLVVYGSLAPGESNHDKLDGVNGVWERGVVHGVLYDRGWGARIGYPALEWQPDGPPVDVHLFTSEQMPQHWTRLDQFEGKDYRRLLVPVFRAGELLTVGQVYTTVQNT